MITYRQASNKLDKVFSFPLLCVLFISYKYNERKLPEETQTRETR